MPIMKVIYFLKGNEKKATDYFERGRQTNLIMFWAGCASIRKETKKIIISKHKWMR